MNRRDHLRSNRDNLQGAFVAEAFSPTSTADFVVDYPNDLPPSTEALVKVVGVAIQNLAAPFAAIRRTGNSTVMHRLTARFATEVSEIEHNIVVEIGGIVYDTIECRVSVVCGSYNLATDGDGLARGLANYFATDLSVSIIDDKIEFTIPPLAIFF